MLCSASSLFFLDKHCHACGRAFCRSYRNFIFKSKYGCALSVLVTAIDKHDLATPCRVVFIFCILQNFSNKKYNLKYDRVDGAFSGETVPLSSLHFSFLVRFWLSFQVFNTILLRILSRLFSFLTTRQSIIQFLFVVHV